jgi:drug/metabolite transporter (DMT)-like permease
MSEPDSRRPQEPESVWHRRIPGIRYISSAAAIVGGVILAIRSVNGLGEGPEGTWLFVGGLGLVVLGLISIPVIRWMDKRGL